MSRVFKDIQVSLVHAPDAHQLVDCMEELRSIYEEMGEDHGHSVFAQVYGHLESSTDFYLTGKILTPSQGDRIKAILAET